MTNTHICSWDGPDLERDPLDITRDVVAKFIADNLTCGIPVAADLARSLQTELHAAGVDVDTLVGSELDNQADEQRAAGA
jgi:hypothetical protein